MLRSVLVCAGIVLIASAAVRADEPSAGGVQFAADFARASGATLTTSNGTDPQPSGELIGTYATAAALPQGQPVPLVMRVTEDATVEGPDGKPGVLRLEYAALPFNVDHSQFIMDGTAATGPVTLPGLKLGAVTPGDLSRVFVEFKFRADEPPGDGAIGSLYQFWIEPTRDDGQEYGRRADFGTLIATPRWRTLRRPLSSANNLEWFLTSLNEDDPAGFRLVWSQNGPIHDYSPGSSLLIDDLKIVIE